KERTMNFFVKEDAFYEWLTPVYLLVGSIAFGVVFYRTWKSSPLKDNLLQKLALLGLTGVFLMAAFEEISWGQRIVNFATPAFVEDVNAQREFTLHNLKFFQGDDAVLPLDFDQLAAIFALTLGLVIPVACAAIPRLGAFVRPIFPVLPIQFSALFAFNYGLQKVAVRFLRAYPDLYDNTTRGVGAAVHEVREHNYALLLMIASIFFMILQLAAMKAQSREASIQNEEQRLASTS
ncbi:MAG: hypothetical protein AB1649_27635, partial [Chloroflexota bacterium]